MHWLWGQKVKGQGHGVIKRTAGMGQQQNLMQNYNNIVSYGKKTHNKITIIAATVMTSTAHVTAVLSIKSYSPGSAHMYIKYAYCQPIYLTVI